MLFDVQSTLAEILSSPLATPATAATPALEIAPVSRVSQVSRSQPAELQNVHALPVSQKSRVSQSQQAGNRAGDADQFRHGRSATGNPVTWTGRIVSLDEWKRLSAWERHGQDGRLFCGACREWVMPGGCPHTDGGAA